MYVCVCICKYAWGVPLQFQYAIRARSAYQAYLYLHKKYSAVQRIGNVNKLAERIIAFGEDIFYNMQ